MLERKEAKFAFKFCNVVDQLITLEELGFKEDGFFRWVLTLHDSDIQSKRLIASSDYLYLNDVSKKDKSRSQDDFVVVWNRDIGGVLSKERLRGLIEFLKAGNVR